MTDFTASLPHSPLPLLLSVPELVDDEGQTVRQTHRGYAAAEERRGRRSEKCEEEPNVHTGLITMETALKESAEDCKPGKWSWKKWPGKSDKNNKHRTTFTASH